MAGSEHQPSAGPDPRALWLVLGLTALGAALRVAGMDQSLYGDELSTYAVISGAHSPADVLDQLHADPIVELTPPLFFLLAEATSQIGDSTVTVRLPSLIAGIALVPLVYLLGLRTLGRTPALLATGLAAISPFLIFYSTDARSYGLAAVLALASTLTLLRAVDGAGSRWWIAYAVASCAAVYTHYNVVFVLGAQALWALWAHREQWRPLVAANVAAAIAFLPWVPQYLEDSDSAFNFTEVLHPFGVETFFRDFGDWSIGMPPIGNVGRLPGEAGAVLIAIGLALAAGALVGSWLGSRTERSGPSNELVLVIALALATPLGMAAYSVAIEDIYYSRLLIPSSPGLMVVLGAMLAAPRMPLRALAVAAVFAGFAIGTVKTLDVDYQRPDYRGAAEFVEAHTEPGDAVYDNVFLGDPEGPVGTMLAVNLDGYAVEHPMDLPAAAAAEDADRIALVSPTTDPAAFESPDLPGFRLIGHELFDGPDFELSVSIYERA